MKTKNPNTIKQGDTVQTPYENGDNTFDGKPIPAFIGKVEHVFVSGSVAVSGEHGLCMYMQRELMVINN